jgi:hypothetical protein
MATVTPNFNWPVPTSTDLVKDGATAIEALGDSIDASLLDLKGGTTGQVLSKNSNTDMDFVWVTDPGGDITGVTAGTGISGGGTSGTVTVTNSMATAITTKGDLVPGTGSGTFARLAAGANGETLVADSSTSTGLRYTAGTVQANPVLNSSMQIAQRGTSFTVTAGLYTLDRWQGYRGVAGSTITRQNTSDTTNLPNIQYCARVARNSGNTATNSILLTQDFETVNSIPYAGKTVTLSFYARAGANYSATSSILYGGIITGTGTDQNNTTGSYTGAAASLGANFNLTTTWQRFSTTGTIPTTSTEMEVKFVFDPTGTAGANDYFEITGVQIDIGSVALPFRTYAATIQGELAACQRYFQIIAEGNSAYIFNGNNWYAFDVRGVYTFPVQMRTAPTLVGTTGTNYYRVQYNTTTDDLNEIKMASATVRNCLLLNDTQAAVTAGTPGTVLTNNAAASVAISAEL